MSQPDSHPRPVHPEPPEPTQLIETTRPAEPAPPTVAPGEEWVDLVDETNAVVGRAPRREVRARNLLHRGVGILCRSSAGELYVHRRTQTKDVFPGLYDMLVGGVVSSGEGYNEAARREVHEELGVEGPPPRFLFYHLYLGPHNRAWVAQYDALWDGPIRHQESEVAWGAWMTLEEILAHLEDWEWVPDGLEIFRRYLRLIRSGQLP